MSRSSLLGVAELGVMQLGVGLAEEAAPEAPVLHAPTHAWIVPVQTLASPVPVVTTARLLPAASSAVPVASPSTVAVPVAAPATTCQLLANATVVTPSTYRVTCVLEE
jgi:hypothetical protein